ncbi:NUDIX hydrolase [Deinococcus cellulosilyticus NBRC 106333 = KACC 11606]|uniref:NUDIX hydrolase n=1 Tax=Deinococcus cellulosilyticus (strain DSM 18568 / NBRC 106333 / KACC 11606 / 5516J-15) TaxID=1223518 RepID=A0A511N609_DEIC1|nr:NUDIX hydrolase [Deinococcus cellulosilyticus NBRC 106333 = KACC 11606]
MLVFEGKQSITERIFYRPLGGGLEEGEDPREGLIREFREELGAEIEILEQLPTLENTYKWADQTKHEVAFLYRIRFLDGSIYDQQTLQVNDAPEVAFWKPLADFASGDWLVPEGLTDLLSNEQTDIQTEGPD